MHDSLTCLQPQFASPVAKFCTSHRNASCKTRPHLEDRDTVTPLGSFCQKAQLVSQRAFFSVARCRPGFYAATTGGEENQGIRVAKVYIRFSKLRFASGAEREDFKVQTL
jgi:hypothetical protein